MRSFVPKLMLVDMNKLIVHYASEDIAAPVTSDSEIKLVMVLVAMAGLTIHILDLHGAFLIVNKDEEFYMKIAQEFDEKYEKGTVLKLN
jgi:Reverse transcriptase (RNA-dependent DNA polymerase)